ncbi:hypothetical protein SAMN02746098_01677 [Desulfosporosinus lacus DSM 15449]|uniref:Tetratricopeptide repeat-containing protein n=2 Tax=Desulfosporosinus TaxID=79206 RepID=A0A1M5WLX9_9FIRM|nr:hypothetical protein SAMN02746098_01677 [Desulfosporosinus lacus DSM 15449]
MFSQRKRGQRSRWKTVFLLFLVSVFMFTVGPFVWRMQQLKHAKSVYDVQKVQEELHWIEKNAALLKNLEIVKDTNLWLALNVGSKGLDESKLASYQDRKHQFWLYLFYLQEGKLSSAQNVLAKMSDSSLISLGKGLMSISKGDAQQSQRLLTDTNMDWKTLSIDEQTLRHLTLAQAAIIGGDLHTAQTELKAAQQLNPYNPACLSMAFNVAIEEEQWSKALELSQLIDAQTWRPANTLFETKKAILAIYQGDKLSLSNILASLKELPHGDAYITYVNGIRVLEEGKLEEGKDLLERSIKDGLEGQLNVDAQKALNQINERLKADKSLRAAVAETNEQW